MQQALFLGSLPFSRFLFYPIFTDFQAVNIPYP